MVSGPWFRTGAWGLHFRIPVLGLRILGFRAWGLGFLSDAQQSRILKAKTLEPADVQSPKSLNPPAIPDACVYSCLRIRLTQVSQHHFKYHSS